MGRDDSPNHTVAGRRQETIGCKGVLLRRTVQCLAYSSVAPACRGKRAASKHQEGSMRREMRRIYLQQDGGRTRDSWKERRRARAGHFTIMQFFSTPLPSTLLHSTLLYSTPSSKSLHASPAALSKQAIISIWVQSFTSRGLGRGCVAKTEQVTSGTTAAHSQGSYQASSNCFSAIRRLVLYFVLRTVPFIRL